MKLRVRSSLYTFLFSFLLFSCTSQDDDGGFKSNFPISVDRVWIGPEYWANPMQDWKLQDGKMLCTVLGRDRNVHLLTKSIDAQTSDFSMSIDAGILQKTNNAKDWVGFKLGAKGEFDDYRSDAVFGKGLNVGVTAMGGLFIGDIAAANNDKAAEIMKSLDGFTIKVKGLRDGSNTSLTLEIHGKKGLIHQIKSKIDADQLVGDVAVVSHFHPGAEGTRATILKNSAWFQNWQLTGSKLAETDDHTFGPILFAQHTLSNEVLKMTAQLPPIGDSDGKEVLLEVKSGDQWQEAARSAIDKDARTATFKVENWDDTKDHDYRISYQYAASGDEQATDTFEGIVRKNPTDKDELVVAGFTGNNDLGFPNQELVESVFKHKPDVLFFSGDQIYEPVGGYGNIHKPLEKAKIDYLRKWIMYGWEYRELLRDIPTVSIPDDHDVYHGNVWGEGGKKAKETGSEKERQDSGGYKLPADFVRMVDRTQTSNLPDPYDPTPIKQGIDVYYTEMNYGGVSFAIIQDRTFKSSPANLLPPEAKAINGWAENKKYDVRHKSDVPGAVLLGERQENFLKDWGANWSAETSMKVLLSQTIFNNVATLPREAVSDVVVSKLRIMKKGDYPEDDVIVSDMDSNGWPHTARNRAVDILRKCFAFHLAGDQHLGSTIHYGVDDWKDAGVAVCVPSISNYFPRRWNPSVTGLHVPEGTPKNLGDFMDGFNNYLTVYAVSNPIFTGKKPSKLHDRAAGFGIVKFHKKSRDIDISLWPRDGDPATSKPYEGWPLTFNQMDNYGRKAYGYLPNIVTEGLEQPPVVKVLDANGEEVYTVRAIDNDFEAKVFANGKYTVIVGEPEQNKTRTLENLKPSRERQEPIIVKF